MSDDHRKRRSSFFPKPVEKSSTENQLELFHNANWVNEEKENIISQSIIFGEQGKKALQGYVEKLKCRKQEYPNLVSKKEEAHINLKEKLRKNKVKIDWETACEELTDFERDFANNRPDYKCLVEKVHSLTLHTAIVKRANYELHAMRNAYNKQANEEIQKIHALFIDKIVEDSGVGTSYINDDTNSLTAMESSEDEPLDSN